MGILNVLCINVPDSSVSNIGEPTSGKITLSLNSLVLNTSGVETGWESCRGKFYKVSVVHLSASFTPNFDDNDFFLL